MITTINIIGYIIGYLFGGIVFVYAFFGTNLFKAKNKRDKWFNFWTLIFSILLWPVWIVMMLVCTIIILIA